MGEPVRQGERKAKIYRKRLKGRGDTCEKVKRKRSFIKTSVKRLHLEHKKGGTVVNKREGRFYSLVQSTGVPDEHINVKMGRRGRSFSRKKASLGGTFMMSW